MNCAKQPLMLRTMKYKINDQVRISISIDEQSLLNKYEDLRCMQESKLDESEILAANTLVKKTVLKRKKYDGNLWFLFN